MPKIKLHIEPIRHDPTMPTPRPGPGEAKMLDTPNLIDTPQVQIRLATTSAFSDLSFTDALADPLIALVNEADCTCERAFVQLMESASRVLFVSAVGKTCDTRRPALSARSASQQGHLRVRDKEKPDLQSDIVAASSTLDVEIPSEHSGLSKVWLVTDFCARHRIGSGEMERLTNLFGSSATADQLLSNARREAGFG
ncbi:hypothetical protein [Rhizobium sp. Rhizsp42]|uniref:hypothetical protein n=1 Tax=Rhizobium sp. Rhizsp42 TaxID=3243034 RepID=UPI0039B0D815